jgi:hypothetical protein
VTNQCFLYVTLKANSSAVAAEMGVAGWTF